MNRSKLAQHVDRYVDYLKREPAVFAEQFGERRERQKFFQSWTDSRLKTMTAEEFTQLLSRLWAMLIWGNKQYVADKIIQDNGLDSVRTALADLLWGSRSVEQRWDDFRLRIKGIGPAMMSELLCHVHPDSCMLWNRRAYVALEYLEVENLPSHDYQLNGKRYMELGRVARSIGEEMGKRGLEDTDLLAVDYFMWRELQVAESLTRIRKKGLPRLERLEATENPESPVATFLHNDVRDKVAEIGQWMGFVTRTEVGIAAGSKVDAVWEATIGNMGRVIYVFEVQTRGSIDSLIINLLKSLKNPAVQGIVAVSDKAQLDRIKKHSEDVSGLHGKLKFWDYEYVLSVHEDLSSAYEAINRLDLVPEGF